MKYYLSRRQAKELRGGKTLRIALPYPDEGIRGYHIHHDLSVSDACPAGAEETLVAWVVSVLDLTDCGACDVVACRPMLVAVDPLSRPAGGLAAVLGGVLPRQVRDDEELNIRVLCVVADLAARRAPRSNYPTQWPGRLVTRRRTLPPEEGSR